MTNAILKVEHWRRSRLLESKSTDDLVLNNWWLFLTSLFNNDNKTYNFPQKFVAHIGNGTGSPTMADTGLISELMSASVNATGFSSGTPASGTTQGTMNILTPSFTFDINATYTITEFGLEIVNYDGPSYFFLHEIVSTGYSVVSGDVLAVRWTLQL